MTLNRQQNTLRVDGADGASSSVLDLARLRQVFGAYPTGVVAVAAEVDGAPVGLAANSFTSVSLDPPLASLCVARSSRTWPVLRRASRLGLSVLSTQQERACRQLAAKSGDRFAELEWDLRPSGAVLLSGASAWLECVVDQEVRAGDHDIVVLRVHDLDVTEELMPLVFHSSQFRRLEVVPNSDV